MTETGRGDRGTGGKGTTVAFHHTKNLPNIFHENTISLVATTYQAQRVMLLSCIDGKISMLVRVMEKPTGLALDTNRLAVCARNMVWMFRAAGTVAESSGKTLSYDLYLAPRTAYVTGDILAHEAAWLGERLLVVNTRFSCLVTLSPDYSFLPYWRPKFISALRAEDRCHLNGLGVRSDGSVVVSALAKTDTAGGWRANRKVSGVLIDVTSDAVISEGLCMPHSPRLYDGRLWVLESGTGSVQIVDQRSGKREIFAKLPGYLRGLAFYRDYAFVGLCSIRSEHQFTGLPIQESAKPLICGIAVLNVRSGATEGMIEFTKGITELFDLAVLPGVRSPYLVGFESDEIEGLFVVPPQ